MKLLYCPECLDMKKLRMQELRRCACGKAWGYYLDDDLTAEIGGTAVLLAIENDKLREAVQHRPARGRGAVLQTRVLPKSYETLRYRDSPRYPAGSASHAERPYTLTSQTATHAKRIWDYLASFSSPARSDVIVLCCSYDLRICDYACGLLRSGLAPKLVFTGKSGNWTQHLWDRPEAQMFRDRALANGVEASQLLTEEEASNIGENIAFTRKLIPDARTVTFVTKPNTILRVKLTAPLQWPDINAHVACPEFRFPEDVSNVIGVFGVIHEMVGDIQRIVTYPEKGFQVAHEIPEDILESWQHLLKQGFDRHMLA